MSRKKRKLKFIRAKNKFRTGQKFVFQIKMSIDLSLDKDIVFDTVLNEIERVRKFYKIPTKLVKKVLVQTSRDIITDMITLQMQMVRSW